VPVEKETEVMFRLVFVYIIINFYFTFWELNLPHKYWSFAEMCIQPTDVYWLLQF